MRNFNVILFNEFETLDVFGPVEVIGTMEDIYHQEYYSLEGGLVTSKHNAQVMTRPFSEMEDTFVLFIPGGGTSYLTQNPEYIRQLASMVEKAQYVLTVCTGSGLLAKTGLLDGRRATTNKMLFTWTTGFGPDVNWVKHARWVKDGRFYTSSGVSAGIDMTLDFIRDLHGFEAAQYVADYIEYVWISDCNHDPFAAIYELD